ncbi:spore germination protein [Sporosarcina sp. Marseille-Q4063]|uniref:spore germination protein n=1 Tax=Sporosarcina sp. Marseille-Q4063 TaxID=2810514 RepID=UPI0020167838|nr:spore germination protein [Sporosarcina sp. Marseille-Q4063]
MTETLSASSLILYIKERFHNTVDLFVEEMEWEKGAAIVVYFKVMTEGGQVNEQLDIIRKRELAGLPNWGDTPVSTIHPFTISTLIEKVCAGSAVVIFLNTNMMLTVNVPSFAVRAPEEPDNEHVIRGSHEGFVEGFDKNMSLIRKRLKIPDLVVQTLTIGELSKSTVNYFYIESLADADVVTDVKTTLEGINTQVINSAGQLEDYLEGNVWSPFPQLLNTERPDRVAANLLEGKIGMFVDNTPTCLIAPITFFTFYQSPDDFNGRVLVGSFYRIVRLLSFITAMFLPAFYIAVIGFHSEILPMEFSLKVKVAIEEIPYRPIFEALLLELFIELIREASIRLPTPIGQTIGIVGGLVIGDAIVSAGLVSNLMVIVVAMTAISSFVVPSVEMNTTIRILRFPFMIAASLFGFFGIVLGSLVLFIHLMNLESLKQPYFSPIVPFDPPRFKKIFVRLPFIKPAPQEKSFTHGEKREGEKS